MEAGVRQGCPLSPLVYAVTAEFLLEKIEQEVAGVLVKAYADDTALVVRNFWEAAPILADIFKDFQQISGLRLNKGKSIVVPLSTTDLQEFANRKLDEVPAWGDMPVQSSCKYLGYMMGPGKGDQSWTGPYNKFLNRVNAWADLPLGLYWDIRTFNTFAITVLGYVASLEEPPAWVLQGIKDTVKKVAKGPNRWVSAEDL